MQGRVRGTAAAFAVALVTAIAAAPAHAARRHTPLVCAAPAPGRGVDADGRLPSGITIASGHTVGADAPTATRCAGTASAGTGVPVHVGIAYSANDLSGNGTLIYRPAPNTTIRAATLWMAGRNGPPEDHPSISLHGGEPAGGGAPARLAPGEHSPLLWLRGGAPPQWASSPPVPLFCGWFQTPCAGFG